MATGVRRLTGAGWGVSITGVAGPGGGPDRSPVGRVHIGLANAGGVRATAFDMRGDREQVREGARDALLELAVTQLDEHPELPGRTEQSGTTGTARSLGEL